MHIGTVHGKEIRNSLEAPIEVIYGFEVIVPQTTVEGSSVGKFGAAAHKSHTRNVLFSS